MSTFQSFNSLFEQPSDPTTHPELECRYERGMREAESSLIECSVRYGGTPVADGGAVLEPFDTPIPRDTVPRPPPQPPKQRGSLASMTSMGSNLITDCVAPGAACFDGVDKMIMAQQDSHESGGSAAARGSIENAQSESNSIGALSPSSRGSEEQRKEGGGATSGNESQADLAAEDADTLHIHAIHVTSPDYNHKGSSSDVPLILLHGYANGALYFYRNLHGLSRHFPAVYSVDMLGWGLSSRPKFCTKDNTVQSAEDFFVEGLEAWRIANDIDKMILGGHSLGGYISVAYCERYPENVVKLLLLSPVGIQDVPDPTASSKSTVRKVMYGVAQSFWSNGWTPGAAIRWVSEWKGKMGVERYVDNRLPGVRCPQERTALIAYLYYNAVLPPSGEGCLNRLLRPGAYAISPCIHRIPELRVGEVVFIYGEKDWMDPSAGLDVERICKQRRAEGRTVPEVTVHAVRNAGHLLMIENWEGFNAAVVMSCGGALEGDMAMHRPASFFDKKRSSKLGNSRHSSNKVLPMAGSETTEESGASQESVEIDVAGQYIVEKEGEYLEVLDHATEATCTEIYLGKYR